MSNAKTRNALTTLAVTIILSLSSACATGGGTSATNAGDANWDQVAELEAKAHAAEVRRALADDVRTQPAAVVQPVAAPTATTASPANLNCDPRICGPQAPAW